jgi:hypothetical protein
MFAMWRRPDVGWSRRNPSTRDSDDLLVMDKILGYNWHKTPDEC